MKDARATEDASYFGLPACLMWTLHDFPRYGLVASCSTKGFKACPMCGPNTMSKYSKVLRKNIYCNCHRRYLAANHYSRGDFAAFNYGAELDFDRVAMSGNETIRCGRESEQFVMDGETDRVEEYPAKQHGVKRVSALFQLAYWRVSSRNHSLCTMMSLTFLVEC